MLNSEIMKVTVCGVVEKDIEKQIEALAKQNQWTKSQTVRILLKEALRKHQPKKKKSKKEPKEPEGSSVRKKALKEGAGWITSPSG